MREQTIFQRRATSALVNKGHSVYLMDITTKLNNFTEEDEVAVLQQLSGVIHAHAPGEFPIMALYLVMVKAGVTISNQGDLPMVSEDNPTGGTPDTSFLGDIINDDYFHKFLGFYRPMGDSEGNLHIRFGYKIPKRVRKLFSSNETSGNKIALIATIANHTALGAVTQMFAVNLKFTVRNRKVTDLIL